MGKQREDVLAAMTLLLTPKQVDLVDSKRGPRSRQQMLRMLIQDGLRYHMGHKIQQDVWHAVSMKYLQEWDKWDRREPRECHETDEAHWLQYQADRVAALIEHLQERHSELLEEIAALRTVQ